MAHMEEFARCLVIFNAKHGIKVGVKPSDDMLLVGVELLCPMRESPVDSLSIFRPHVHPLGMVCDFGLGFTRPFGLELKFVSDVMGIIVSGCS